MAWIFDRYKFSNRLQLGYEEYMRPMSVGANWQSIRVGVRFCINDSARYSFYQWSLSVGLCQGLSGIQSDSTTDYIGCFHGTSLPDGASGGSACNFNAGTPNYFTAGNIRAVRKVGSAYTFATYLGLNNHIVGSGQIGGYGSYNMSAMYVDFLKGSGTMTLTNWFPSSPTLVQTNITDSIFVTHMERTPASITPVYATASHSAIAAGTAYDTVSVACFKTWPPVEIDAIAAVRLT